MMRAWIEPGLVESFAREGTDTHRIFTGPDGWAERFGPDVLVSYKNEAERDRVVAELPGWAATARYDYRRIFGRFLPRQNAEREAPRLIAGNGSENLETVIRERGLVFGLDFAAGYSVGFFLDQRENRWFLRRRAPRHVLNCFAYTCSFSVVAASIGAATLSIDLSKKSLARGRQNFALNALAPDRHRFMADDVTEVLPRLARKHETFDAIILDPPTFSRGSGGRAFQVEHDFEGLLTAALELAAPGAEILLSTNCTRLHERDLERMARFAFKATRKSGIVHREPALPDFPAGSAARTLWLTVR